MSADVSIYALCDPDTGDVRYIGRTANPKLRLYAHAGHARQGTRHAPATEWVRDLLAAGRKPSLRVLDVVSSGDAAMAEQRTIAAYRAAGCSLVNATHNGAGGRPRKGDDLMDTSVTIRMTQEFYEQLAEAAKDDRRRIGEFTRILLEDGFKEWRRTHPSQDPDKG